MLFRRKRSDPEPLADPNYYGFPEVEELRRNLEAAAQAVKAVELPEMPELPELPELPSPPLELPELPKKAKPELKKLKEQEAAKVEAKEKRPLFIRIDKFKEMLASVEAIEKKLKEIALVIQKLKELRGEETKTMQAWESAIQELKARLETIEKNLAQVE